MSDVNALAAAEAASDPAVTMSEDDALAAAFDQAHADSAQERDEGGRFAAADAGEGAQEADPAANPDDPDAAAPADPNAEADQQAAAPAVPLPPNWTGAGMDEAWAKIPPDVQAKIAARDAEIHSRMSEQGRQLGAFKPLTEVLERNADLLEGRTDDQGRPIDATFAVDFLMNAQRMLDRDPVRSVLEIAARYSVLPQIAAVLSGQAQLPPAQQPQRTAGASPADVQAMVREGIAADHAARSANEEVSRLSSDKPLYAEIAEAEMVHAIHRARERLGDTASNEAVFNLAYDMAVHADPTLRAKAQAAAKPPAAQKPDPKAEAARRAASINVTSRSSGNGRKLTEDEELAAAFDAAHKDR